MRNLTPEEFVNTSSKDLEDLIPIYGEEKTKLDSLKKICDEYNSKIKDCMSSEGINEKIVDGWKVKYSEARKENINEEKLIFLLKQAILKGTVPADSLLIKTKEYVDMNVLEDLIYKGIISKELLLDIDSCREVKLTPTLKISKMKGE